MSEAESAGTLAAQSEGSPVPELHPQLADAILDFTFQPDATDDSGATNLEGADETLATAQPISLKGPEVSEDEGNGGSGSAGKKKKQRSMAELIKGLDLNMGDDGVPIDEAAVVDEATAALLPPSSSGSTPKSDEKTPRKRKKAVEADDNSNANDNGEAKASPASPTTAADPEAQQNLSSHPDNGASGRRERKKSKYLSPPYTMVIDKKTGAAFGRSAFGDVLDPDDDASAMSSPLGRCSSFGRKRKEKEEDQDLDSPFVFDEASLSIDKLLAELKCTAVGVVYLVSSPNASAVRGYFALLRSYSYSEATTETASGGSKAPSATTPAKAAPVEETKTPGSPIAGDSKASFFPKQEHRIGGDTTKTPVASDEKPTAEEGNNKSASGKKRSYKKKTPAPEAVVAPTTTESNGTVQVAPRPSGRPRKKNKVNEENKTAVDGSPLTMVFGLSPMPNLPAEVTCNNNRPTSDPTPTPPAPVDTGSNKPAAASPAAAPAPAVTDLQANGGSSAPAEQNDAKRKKRRRRCGPPGSASIIVTFAPGAQLPTKEHVLGFFGKYGTLDDSRTEVRAAKRVVCLVYTSKADAQKAIASPDRDQAFGPGVANFRIKYARQARQVGVGAPATHGVPLPAVAIPRPPLEFVKKSLEDMINVLEESRAAGSNGPDTVAAEGTVSQEDPRDYLVDQMSGLLVKVNKLLADGAAGEAVANGGVDAAEASAAAPTVSAAEASAAAPYVGAAEGLAAAPSVATAAATSVAAVAGLTA